jgi:hypothetical protein
VTYRVTNVWSTDQVLSIKLSSFSSQKHVSVHTVLSRRVAGQAGPVSPRVTPYMAEGTMQME